VCRVYCVFTVCQCVQCVVPLHNTLLCAKTYLRASTRTHTHTHSLFSFFLSLSLSHTKTHVHTSGIADKFNLASSKDRFWRHMSLQLDEVSNTLRFFLDGVQAIESRLCTSDGGFQDVADAWFQDVADASTRTFFFDGFGFRV